MLNLRFFDGVSSVNSTAVSVISSCI
jgi:hypothetical protein